MTALNDFSTDWQVCVAAEPPGEGSSVSDESSDEQVWQQVWYDSHVGVMFGEKFTELSCKLERLEVDESQRKSFFSRLQPRPPVCVITASS